MSADKDNNPTSPRTGRAGKVSIAAYFDEPVRRQLAIMAAVQGRTQTDLMAEALNLLFMKYGQPSIAKA